MSRKFEVTAITGKYTDNQGNEKSRYLNIGAVIETRNGLMLKLEAVPVGWDGWAYRNEPKPRDGQQRQQPARQQHATQRGYDDSEDVPF